VRFQSSTVTVLFLLGCCLLLTNSVASAGPKEDVATATMKWGQTLGEDDPDKIVLLYATDGVLWERSLQPCDRIERPCVIISSQRSRSCPASRVKSQGCWIIETVMHSMSSEAARFGG